MENGNDLEKKETNRSAPTTDPGAAIETVTPSTEELIPETPSTKKEEEKDQNQSSEPTEKDSEDKGDEGDINNIETVAP